jgi:hypothetical protein
MIICTILAPAVLAVVVVGIILESAAYRSAVVRTGGDIFATVIPLVGVASTTLSSSGATGRCWNNKEHQHHGKEKCRCGGEKLHDVVLEERRKRTIVGMMVVSDTECESNSC